MRKPHRARRVPSIELPNGTSLPLYSLVRTSLEPIVFSDAANGGRLFRSYMQACEYAFLETAMERIRSLDRCAAFLGISRSKLRPLLTKYGLKPPPSVVRSSTTRRKLKRQLLLLRRQAQADALLMQEPSIDGNNAL